jgi:hypothetical protein
MSRLLAAIAAALLLSLPAAAQAPPFVPVPGIGTGISPVVSTAAEGSHVLLAKPGNLYTLTTTIGATSGWIMLFDAVTDPPDGAVPNTLRWCKPVLSNGTLGGDTEAWPPNATMKFSTGITVAFSSTGCGTKTESATAFFYGEAQ